MRSSIILDLSQLGPTSYHEVAKGFAGKVLRDVMASFDFAVSSCERVIPSICGSPHL